MFHKFFVGETEEEKRQRIKEEEAAAAMAYKEWEKQQEEVYAIQTSLINMMFRYILWFWLVVLQLLYKTIRLVINTVLKCKNLRKEG